MKANTAGSLKFLLRYGMWTEMANIFRILNDLLLMLVWFVGLSGGLVPWGESLGVLGIIHIGSFLVSRLMHSLQLKLGIERVLIAAWIILCLLLSYRLLLLNHIGMTGIQFYNQIFAEALTGPTIYGFWVILFSMIAILRGVQTARYPVSSYETIGGFRLSLILFAISALIFHRYHLGIFLPSFFLFLLSSLAGLVFSRVSDLSEHNGGRVPVFNRQWAFGIGGSALAVILLSLLASLVINLNIAELIGKGLTLLLQLLTGAVVVISSPILIAIVAVVQFLLKLIAPALGEEMEQFQFDLGENMIEELQESAAEKTTVDPALFLLIAVIVVIVVVILIQIKRRNSRQLVLMEEDSLRAEKQPAKNRLLDLLPTREKRKKRASARDLFAAARIRFVYAQLMDMCDRLGKPRPRAVTPLEFLPRMKELFPSNGMDLQIITAAYIKIRYGELPEMEQDVNDVMQAWQRVSDFGKAELEERSKNLRRNRR